MVFINCPARILYDALKSAEYTSGPATGIGEGSPFLSHATINTAWFVTLDS